MALIAAAVAAYKRDHDEAEAFAARAERPPTAWARLRMAARPAGGGAVTPPPTSRSSTAGSARRPSRVERSAPASTR